MNTFAKICRICLRKIHKHFIKISTADSDGINIIDKITYCIPEIGSDHTGLPETICGNCYKDLEQFCKFKKTFIENNKTLKSYFEKLSQFDGETSDLIIQMQRINTSEMMAKNDEKGFDCNNIILSKTRVNSTKEQAEILTIDSKRYICPVCKKAFAKQHSLKMHFASHPKAKFLRCQICANKYVRQEDLNNHLKILHNKYENKPAKTMPVKIEKALLLFPAKKSPKIPIKDTSQKQVFDKNNIDEESDSDFEGFDPISSQNTNKNNIDTESDSDFEGFDPISSQNTNKNNIDTESNSDLERFDSIPSQGTSENKLGCGMCTEVFTQESLLIQHLMSHFSGNIKCSVCSKVYACNESLQKHIWAEGHQNTANATNESTYSDDKENNSMIDNIDKTNPNVSEPSKKTARAHTWKKTMYPCSVCNKSFSYLSSLKSHAKIHAAKPLQELNNQKTLNTKSEDRYCEICKKYFTSKSILTVHMKRIHCHSKGYICQYCKKFFTKQHELNSHRRIHYKNAKSRSS